MQKIGIFYSIHNNTMINNRHIPIIFSETLEEDFRRTNKRDLLIELENERKKLVKSKQPIDWENWFDLIRKHEVIGKIGVATAMLAYICFPVALEFLFMQNATWIVAPLAGIALPG